MIGGTYRVLAQHVDDVTTVTAVPLDDVQRTISRLVLVEVVGSLAILAALGVVSWWVVHLGIRPIKEMTETASLIAAGDLAVRVPDSAPAPNRASSPSPSTRCSARIDGALDERAASEDAAAPIRRRRLPRAADSGDDDPRLRRAVPPRRAQRSRALDDAMRRTEQEAARIGRLVEDMLALARLDEQRPLAVQPVDLTVLARDAAADARAAAPERAIVVEAGPTPIVVNGDEDRLRQVIANVVGNALVHTAPDVPVTIRVVRDGTAATLAVEDRGQGMTPDVTQRVTERFFRADPSRSRHRGGTGLGLSIVDATVAAHGGAVEIDSEPGSGTTVRLTVPLATDPRD